MREKREAGQDGRRKRTYAKAKRSSRRGSGIFPGMTETGRRWMRAVSLTLALLLAAQPAAATAAADLEQATLHGDGYTIVAHADGSKTMTFIGELVVGDVTADRTESSRAGSKSGSSGDKPNTPDAFAQTAITAEEAAAEELLLLAPEGEAARPGENGMPVPTEESQDGVFQEDKGLTGGAADSQGAGADGETDRGEDAQAEGDGEAGSLPEVVSTVEEKDGRMEVTVSCGSLSIQFVPEIHEAEAAQLSAEAQPLSSSPEGPDEQAGMEEGQPEAEGSPAEAGTGYTAEPEDDGAAKGQTETGREPEEGTKKQPAQTKPETVGGAAAPIEPGPETEAKPEPATETERETNPEPATEAGQKTNQEPGAQPDGGTETAAETEPSTEAGPKFAPGSETGAELEAGPEPETETVTEPETEPGTAAGSETETEAGTEPGTEAVSETETESESEAGYTTIPDSELRYTQLPNGIKEELVIYGYRGGHSVSCEMDLGGLTPIQEGNGFSLADEDGRELASISEPYLYDTAGQTSYAVETVLKQLPNGRFLLTYTPSDSWLSDPVRSWPVVLDPTLTINQNEMVEDNYTDGKNETHHDHNGSSLYAGTKSGTSHTAYIRPAFTDAFKDIASKVIIQDAKVHLYVKDRGGKAEAQYSFYQVAEEWTSTTITGKNAPALAASPFRTRTLGSGANTVNIKPLVSNWFNCLNQSGNYGFAIQGDGTGWVELGSADQNTANTAKRVWFEIEYKEVKKTDAELSFTATPYGNELNSGSGSVTLSWNPVAAAEAYYVGVFDGAQYEYLYVGNVTSWSTAGKGLWPTEAEVSQGRYLLHGDGAGGELPCIPAFTYANVPGGAYGSSLSYFFKVVPSNDCMQAASPGLFSPASAILPDRVSPNQAAEVAVFPNTWNNQAAMEVTWSGVRDFTTSSVSILDTLAGGCIQYAVDTPEEPSSWVDTAANTSSGTISFPTAQLADGVHAVYIRGKDGEGNTGAPKGALFYVDREGPFGHTASVFPDTYTNQESAALSWSGMQDVTPIAAVEYRLDGGPWMDTGIPQGSFAGYPIDISQLSDGVHTAAVRGRDSTGNTGAESSVSLFIDRTPPEAGKIRLDPEGRSREDEALLSWEGASDGLSGLAKLEYSLDGEWRELPCTTLGEVTLDLSGLSDGAHPVSLRAWDAAGNSSETGILEIKRDTTPPYAALTWPGSRAMLDGTVEVRGSVEDAHLAGWELSACDSFGDTVILGSGEGEVFLGTLGRLDLAGYGDGENLVLALEAWDEAGNRTLRQRRVIRVGGSMSAFTPTLDLEVPEEAGEAQVFCSYQPTDGSTEQKTYLYVDGALAGVVSGGSFPLDAVCFEEGSVHTVSAVFLGKDGKARYSQGLGMQQFPEIYFAGGIPALQDAWETDGTGNAGEGGALDGAEEDDGEEGDGAPGPFYTWMGEPLTAAGPILGLRLDVTDFTPGSSAIRYEYTADGGKSWTAILPGVDAAFGEPADTVQVRVVFTSSGEEIPQLYRLSAAAVLELAPQTVTARLFREAGQFVLRGPVEVRKALTEIKTTLTGRAADTTDWYLDGIRLPFLDHLLDARYIGEDRTASLSGIAWEEGEPLLSGGSSMLLLRTALGEGTGTAGNNGISGGVRTADSGEIPCPRAVQALRLDASVHEETALSQASFRYSTDGGVTWREIQNGGCAALPEAASRVRIQAQAPEGVSITGWQLVGYAADGLTVKADLTAEPTQVWAADYGKTGEPRYVLSWQDNGALDGTAAGSRYFRIYKDGALVAQAEESPWTDTDYQAGASYGVSAVSDYRTYSQAPFALRESRRVGAEPLLILPDQRDGALTELKEFTQEPQLSSLYGGDFTFVLDEDPPDDKRALDQSLLGKNKQCSLGWEPVNFNTGNFFLEALDYGREEETGPALLLLRTYNSQSDTTDGPFGEKWATELTQYLSLYRDGTIGLRKEDGALVLFERGEDGAYACTTADHLGLVREGEGFAVSTPEGKEYRFGRYGLLEEIRMEGRSIRLERDGRNVLESAHLADGATLSFETDGKGHVTALSLPGGGRITYEYDGNRLVEVTDPLGNRTRYEYDGEGRMTAWYDATGTCQAENVYDSEGRVAWQRDARGGEYTLSYYEDHTVAVDSEGRASEIWFDSRKRTIREVDAEGHTYRYAYDEAGNLCAKTDGEGRLTSYAYDREGNLTETTLPDGTRLGRTYDMAGRLLAQTDGNGNETRYEYDGSGRLVKTIYPDGGEELRRYDSRGRLESETTPGGGTTAYAYDAAGNLVLETDALGNETRYEYDGAGNLVKKTGPDGAEEEYGYDAAGRRIWVEYADGSRESCTYDALGNVASVTDTLGFTTSYRYDVFSNCVETVYPDGSRETASYSPDGSLLCETDQNGNTTSYTYDGAGNLLSKTDPLGNTEAYAYDGSGRMTKAVAPSGGEETYEYAPATGLLTRCVDASGTERQYEYDGEGNVTALYVNGELAERTEYDSMGRMAAKQYADGSRESYAYDLDGNLTIFTDALGGQALYSYDANGNMVSKTDPLGNTTAFSYDAAGNLERVDDGAGAVTSYAYDLRGNCVSVTDALGGVTSYEYDTQGRRIKETDPLGNETRYRYDAAGNLVLLTAADGGQTSYTYDAKGNLLEACDPLGAVSHYRYDGAGNLVAAADAFGQESSVSYDASGSITGIASPEGEVRYTYDGAGRLIRIRDAQGNQTEYQYDSLGQVVQEENEIGSYTYEYDAAGNLSKASNGEGNSVSYRYDAYGRLLEALWPDGTKDCYTYDALGRLTREETRDGASTEYTYDAAGNLLSQISGESSSLYEYDLLGRMTSATVNGSRTEYEYDAAGNLIQVTDALGGVSAYGYDPAGRVARVTDALGGTSAYRYDLAGNLILETDPLGNETSYRYSPEGLLLEKVQADGSAAEYTYDSRGALILERCGGETLRSYTWEDGNLAAVEDDSGRISFDYDENGSLARIRYPNGETVSYTYQADGNLASVTDGNGNQTAYAYDQAGNLSAVMEPDGRVTLYTYDSQGRAVLQESGGLRTETSYNSRGLVERLSVSGDTSLELTYLYDLDGNPVQETRREEGRTSVSSYAYDALGRLTQWETEDGKKETYTYDAAGNMTERVRISPEGTARTLMEYNAAGQLLARKGEGGVLSYSYDALGNLVKKSLDGMEDTYSYYADGKLAEYRGYDGYTVSYTYSAAGTLTEKQSSGDADRRTLEDLADGAGIGQDEPGAVDGGQTPGRKASTSTDADTASSGGEAGNAAAVSSYVYSLLQENPQILSETVNGQKTSYTYGMARLGAYGEDGTETVYVYDGQGSVAQTLEKTPVRVPGSMDVFTDRYSSSITSFSYTPFGETLQGAEEDGYGYKAEAWDEAVGNLYLRERWYEPAMMRFGQKDAEAGSLWDPQSQNRYTYARSSPVRYADPSGRRITEGDRDSVFVSPKTGALAEGREASGKTAGSASTGGIPSMNEAAAGIYNPLQTGKAPSTAAIHPGTQTNSQGRKVTVTNPVPVKPSAGRIVYVDMPYNAPYRNQPVVAIPVKGAGSGTAPTLKELEAISEAAGLSYASRSNNMSSGSYAPGKTEEVKAYAEWLDKNVSAERACEIYLATKKQVEDKKNAEKEKHLKAIADNYKEYNSEDYKNFWNRTDGFFDGKWWENREKMEIAFKMLESELNKNGKLNLLDVGKENQVNKINFLIELADPSGRNHVGSYTGEVQNLINVAMVAVHSDAGYDHIDIKTLKNLLARYDKRPLKNANEWYNNGGDRVIDGAFIIAIGKLFQDENFVGSKNESYKINDLPENVGYSSYSKLKKAIGSAGAGKEWHHIVEQSQIKISGFTPESVNNTSNIIAIDSSIHKKISGYYSSKPAFTKGKTVRKWLAGQDFKTQYDFGIKILKKFGVIK